MSQEHASYDHKPCLWCAEPIRASARICRYCNREQHEPKPETLLYEGHGHPPIGEYILWAIACVVCIGFVMLPYAWLQHRNTIYRVTTRQIERRRGVFSKNTEVVALARVTDIRFQSDWGFGTVVLLSSDATAPRIDLPVPGAQQLFEKLRYAIEEERQRTGVVMREQV